MELIILEKWSMYVRPPKEKGWFLDYVVRSPRQSGVHLTAGWHAYKAVSDLGIQIDSAVEYFGGIGAQSLMIQDLFKPSSHLSLEYSEEALRHMQTHSPLEVDTRMADSYDPGNYTAADLVGLDFGDLTVWKTREGEKHRALLDRVFAGEPQAVVLTDVACRFMHLHRERYEALLGPESCATYPRYLEALADRLEGLYGYVVVGGYWDRWSTVMALVPDGERAPFVPTPSSPLGLEITL